MAELDKVYAAQYGANVYTMAQQRGSILRPYVTIEEMKGERRFFDRVGSTAAQKVEGLYENTPLIHTPFSRRCLYRTDYVWADMVDWGDDLNVFIDPTSSIVQAGAMALGRALDKEIIYKGFYADALEGANGTEAVVFPEEQKVNVAFGATGNVGLTVEKLRRAYALFCKADVDLAHPDNELYIAVSQQQMEDLITNVDIRNAQYSAILDLYCGKTDKFMGFKFIRTEQLQYVDEYPTVRTCVAWCKSGIVCCVPQEIQMTVNTRPDKNNMWQAAAKMGIGATRLEDAKVVHIFCQEETAAAE